jgi:hypothetical protein
MASNETIGSPIPSIETTKFPFPGFVVFQKKVKHDFYSTTGEKRKEKKEKYGVRKICFIWHNR